MSHKFGIYCPEIALMHDVSYNLKLKKLIDVITKFDLTIINKLTNVENSFILYSPNCNSIVKKLFEVCIKEYGGDLQNFDGDISEFARLFDSCYSFTLFDDSSRKYLEFVPEEYIGKKKIQIVDISLDEIDKTINDFQIKIMSTRKIQQ